MSHLFDPSPHRAASRCALFVLVALLLPAGAATQAGAAGDVVSEEGVTLRLVAERPGADGRFRAALLVDLEPGWKTYWLDPGEGGLPPKIAPRDASATAGFALRFPVPHRSNDAGGRSNVYSASFAVAIEGQVQPETESLDLKVNLGICETVCVPVSTELGTAFPARAGIAGPVDEAFHALPKPSTPEAGIVAASVTLDKKTLLVTTRAADDAGALDLFVAGPKGWTFGLPTAGAGGGNERVFALPILGKPRKGPDTPDAISAILVAGPDTWAADALAVGTDGTRRSTKKEQR